MKSKIPAITMGLMFSVYIIYFELGKVAVFCFAKLQLLENSMYNEITNYYNLKMGFKGSKKSIRTESYAFFNIL